MPDVEIIQDILTDALKKEKQAEDNCVELLKQLATNGFHEQIEKIKNDEIKHQEIVKELIEMIK